MSDVTPSEASPTVTPTASVSDPPAVSPSAIPFSWLPLLIAGLYLVFYQIALQLPGTINALVFSTLVALGLLVWLPAQLAHTVRKPAVLAGYLMVSSGLFAFLFTLVKMKNPAMVWFAGHLPGLPGVLQVLFAASLGALLSRIVRSANLIPPVAAVLALVDIWTVLLNGPVKQIMSSPSPAAKVVTQALTVQMAAPKVGAAPIPVVGFADFMFIAFFTAAITRFVPQKSVYKRMVWTLIGVLCVYMLLALFSDLSLPALVPMAVVMLALHWRYFHYERSELFAMLYAALFIAAIAAGFWFFSNRMGGTDPSDKIPANSPRAALSADLRSA